MNFDFEKLFRTTTFALYLNRSHPYIKRDIKWFVPAFLWHAAFTSIFILIVYNLIYHDIKYNNFAQICKNGVMVIVYTTISFQYFVLIYHQNSLLTLVTHIKNDYKMANELSMEEQKIIQHYANRGSYVSKQWLGIGVVGTTSFCIKSIILMIYYYSKNEFRLVQYYDLFYPGVMEEKRDTLFVYSIVYALLMNYGFYCSVMYVAYVPLGPLMMMHACGQLNIVETRINNLFTELDDEVIKRKLKGIIMQLQCIYSFVDLIKDVFKIAYELSLKSTTIMLPVAFYEIIEGLNHGEFSLEFCTFIVGGVLYSSTPCYYSQELLNKGEDVRQALYCCGWERYYDRRTRTTLHILLLYALRPIAINTVFKTLCLDTLTDVFQQSYTIFNLMNAMFE